MGNQIAVRVLTRPGDLIVAGKGQHVVSFEMGASARNSSVQFALVDDTSGQLDLSEVLDVLDAELDHQPHVAMVAVENTHMPSGGTPWSIKDLRSLAHAIGERPLHLDGARLFNAVVATGTSAAEYAATRHHGHGVPLEGTLCAGRVPARGTSRPDRRRPARSESASAGRCAKQVSSPRRASSHSTR